ncbi:U2 snRNP-associated protein Sap130 [Schizosaccharomyces japonicus yFS275]|uniref:U2 snRNP-associated protein Sap130 n=1 Tax=Schizosaccharomyces japonicus (strain yFS275 / FY16936) TaxID=402676 RepID=B6K1S3_SCHJY|nr:U2 snRNP-associated protein Sap130 [Schizosaccharomyces japonicus yFS275]EEB07104.1 U2 snRNP-associated protein Sap130 [Schizosaccharomyces japonicus yFS275]
MDTFPSLFLYSLTAQNSNYVQSSCVAQLTGKKAQEIVIATGSRVHVYRIDPNEGRMNLMISQNCYGIVRNIAPLRLTGFKKDYLVLTSDSGRFTILEYDIGKNKLVSVYQEAFGKSGIRRIVPGEYLALDAKGRAAMVASTEKNKLVYVLNRDSEANLTISSPLEAHKAGTICFDLVGLDTGYENPIFAALEVEYSDLDHDPLGELYKHSEKVLTYYELDLGLNHVVKRWSKVVDRSAYKLIRVPGGNDGPSGVIVISTGWISYRHLQRQSHFVPIPTRETKATTNTALPIIVSAVMHKMRDSFFYLLQNSDGDLLKLTMELDDHSQVKELRIKYFDTIPFAAILNILKSGLLFAGCEGGNHHLYQFESLAIDDDEPEFSSANFSEEQSKHSPKKLTYKLHPLQNISLLDEIPSLFPLTDAIVTRTSTDANSQLYTLCGRHKEASLRLLKRGVSATEVVLSELPGAPIAIWTVKQKLNDPYDKYMVLSFTNGTLVLSIGETVEEVLDSGLLSSVSTLNVRQLGRSSVVQIHSKGIRCISANKEVTEWKTPADTVITNSAINEQQIVVSLSNDELAYFEMDDEYGQLNEYQERKLLTSPVTALALGPVPQGSKRSNFLCLASEDSTVRIVSLDPYTTLENLSVQALSAPASSLCMVNMEVTGYETLYLHIGLSNGVYLRTVVDVTSGQLIDTRTRFLGPRPIRLSPIIVRGKQSVLAIANRSYLSYSNEQTLQVSPLLYSPLEYADSFASHQCPEGIVGIHQNILKIFTVEATHDDLKQDVFPLSCTPKRVIKHPELDILYILQSERHCPNSTNEWITVLSIFDMNEKKMIEGLTFNEASFDLCYAFFRSRNEGFLVCSSAINYDISKQSCSNGVLRVYSLNDGGLSLKCISETETDSFARVLKPFHGRLIAGVGPFLRVYDLGNKKLLRKSEVRAVPNFITTIQTQGYRIIVTDAQHSAFFVVFKPEDNRYIVFADDCVARWATATAMVDYDTVVGGDKFSNLWLLRCPESVSQLADEENSGSKLLHEKPFLHSSPHKLDLMAHTFVNDIPTSIQKVQLVEGARDVIMWTGLLGTIGVLSPFVNREDVRFFQQLESLLRAEDLSIVGRDHLAYRSYYVPVKCVVDGDLCEQYYNLPRDKQESIANELDRTVIEVCKKIEDLRVRSF